jgi:CheY-like chemotaxis protein
MQTHSSKGSDLRYRLGGARADFVASLGRKIADARTVLLALEQQRGSKHLANELMRRMTALAQGAKLLRFEAMDQALAESLAILHRAAHEGEIAAADTQLIGQILEDLPALAWGESPRRGNGALSESKDPPAVSEKEPETYSVLVVGAASIGDALTYDDPDGLSFACENTDDAQAGIDIARALAPDVIILDADIAYAAELTEALLDDPLTEPTPIVVIGTFLEPGSRETYIAMGVSRVLTKPLPHERLRRACEEAVFSKEGRAMRVVLGEPTIEQLGTRLADEVRLALVSAVDAQMRGQRVPLGEGTEVLGAIWGAIARVREVVTARTSGAVRFTTKGPEGAIALAPSLDVDAGAGLRGASPMRGTNTSDVRLAGRTVLVTDDDPGVVWFISDLLKAAGCTVIEAHDGAQALDLAWKHIPDVVVSDILMPKLDGFALARRLKRDVVLRDVPVVLLSWKEDLLSRVRELGAGAAAYLRKESDARAMVSRIRESLRAKTRVEARLRSEGEVRGRLDGVTVRSLLDIVCRTRDAARVSVRDASFLYEVEIRDGAPARATRTAGDGSFMNGPKVLAAMLGIGAARFIVAPSTGSVQPDLVGELSQQLARPIAVARAAQTLLSGPDLFRVAAVGFEPEALADYARATPAREKALLAALQEGTAPRELIESGNADIALLEDLLLDLAARGVISSLEMPKGCDVLTPAVDAALKLVDARARGLIGSTPSPNDARAIKAITQAEAELRKAKAERAEAKANADAEATANAGANADADADANAGAHASEHEQEKRGEGLLDMLAAPSPSPNVVKEPDPTDVEDTFFAEGDRMSEEKSPSEGISVSVRIEESAHFSAPVRSDTPMESVKVKEVVGPRPEGKRWPLLFGMTAAVGVAALAFFLGNNAPPRAASNAAEPPPPAQETVADDIAYVDMPAGARVEPGQGILEVTHEGKDSVRVDGLDRGASATLSLPLWAGNHDVRSGAGEAEHSRVVEVRPGKIARVRLP